MFMDIVGLEFEIGVELLFKVEMIVSKVVLVVVKGLLF